MKLIKVILLCFVSLFGCDRLNKEYNFEKKIAKFEYGTISTRIEGTFSSRRGLTEKNNPYKVMLAFDFDSNFTNCQLVIDTLEMINSKTSQNVLKKVKISSDILVDLDGKTRAYFSFDSLNLEHVDYILKSKYIIEYKQEQLFNDHILIRIKREYNEYRSNDFWDKWMSI